MVVLPFVPVTWITGRAGRARTVVARRGLREPRPASSASRAGGPGAAPPSRARPLRRAPGPRPGRHGKATTIRSRPVRGAPAPRGAARPDRRGKARDNAAAMRTPPGAAARSARPGVAPPGIPSSAADRTRGSEARIQPGTARVSLIAGRVKYRLGPSSTRISTARTDATSAMGRSVLRARSACDPARPPPGPSAGTVGTAGRSPRHGAPTMQSDPRTPRRWWA